MSLVFLLLSAICAVGAVIAWVIILIEAFQDQIWKGALFFLCWIYALYYALFEFEHDNKWQLVLLAFGGGAMAASFRVLAR